MSLAAAIAHVRDLLDGIAMPFPSVELAAYITPPDPNVETHIPTLYVLTAEGPEKRLTVPRNTGPGTAAGDKTVTHRLKLHVIWELPTANPAAPGAADPDLLFSGVIDGIMKALRTTTAPVLITDPWDGTVTQLVDPGENMTYEYFPRHAVRNQRMLRYDAIILMPVQEVIQA